MKKIFGSLALVSVMLCLQSCNNQPKANDTKEKNQVESNSAVKGGAETKFAYVEIDSIMSQYTYWKDVSKIMKEKEANIQKTLSSKQQAIQQAAAKFESDIRANKYTQAQAQQVQASIQKQAQDAEALQMRLGNEYQNEVAKYNKALSDSVHNYLKAYNKDNKYTMIFAKSGDNILYADQACDITKEVVKGLNMAYKAK